jgi:hypothetical protein
LILAAIWSAVRSSYSAASSGSGSFWYSAQKAHGRVQQMERHMDLLLRRLFGRSSEKFDPRQGVLFDLLKGPAEEPAASPAPPEETHSANGLWPNRHPPLTRPQLG